MKSSILLSLLVTLSLFVTLPHDANSAKILSVSFFSSKSHKITYNPLLIELAKRGHQVTVLSPHATGKEIPNLTDVKTVDFDEFMESKMPNFFEMKEKNEMMNPMVMIEPIVQLCKDTYALPQTKKIMGTKYDLVIAQPVFNECMVGLMYKLNTTTILITPTQFPTWVNTGSPAPPSFIPTMMLDYPQDMTFGQRVINFASIAFMQVIQDYYYKPKMEAVYREALNDPDVPSVDTILSNASIFLSNSHFSTSQLRPFLPDVIEVGGMHMEPAKPLPKDLEDFVKSSGENGFIFFSMGTALKGSTMPERYRQIFLKAFGKLKQKVLWKWETEKMEGLPANVKLSKWLPQQDVLGHPKIKLFISHGGQGSTSEAIFHGVPILGIPMFGDQLANIKKSIEKGWALGLDINTITADDLYQNIQEMLENQTYSKTIKRLSNLLRDQENPPLEKAVFWTEYVLRHQGAVHLRSPARELNNFQYHSIDVIAFIFMTIFIVLYILIKTVKFIFRKVFCLDKKNHSISTTNGKKYN